MAQSIYRPGTFVWLVDKEQRWLSGEVKSFAVAEDGRAAITVKNEQGEETTVKGASKDAGAEEGGLPPLQNTAEFRTINDLTRLPHLNEPSILEVIRNRFSDRCLYTYSGIVLIAVNPFADTTSYYAPDVIRSYIGRSREELDPHLFAVAEEAFSTMERTGKAQSIIVSGESGSGKTESAKYIMRYLASVHGHESTGGSSGSSSIEQQILATNPILEAFGNAKTARNDNSSRFGKYIQILFDDHQRIVGARMRTYLLERSRLTFQQPLEGNYHIFYQLCSGASENDRHNLGLDDATTDFRYLGGMPPQPTQAPYTHDFSATCDALEVVGIGEEKRQAIFQLLAGLLHVGNIEIRSKRDTKDATMDEDDVALLRAAALLGIDAKGFAKCTTAKQIDARGEIFSAARTVAQAIGVRDGVAQYIYSCLFDWLAVRVNSSLLSDTEHLEATFIAVLDIYGFEHFEKNSFEQFCINYANEKLQQQFLSHVFKLDQAEYVEEGIPWNAIDFPDNQPCINLIEGKIGVISLLDEESRLAAGTDTSFVDKLNGQLKMPQNKRIFKDHLHGNTAFKIAHYAGDVSYSVDGFLEKNRGTVPEEHLVLLTDTTNAFLLEVIQTGRASVDERTTTQLSKQDPNAGDAPRRGANRKPTQSSVFKSSLVLLMDTLDRTDVHYIRCIKPNEDKQPWKFQSGHVLDQLRACGVLETVKISRAGYPSRMPYEEFAARYSLLLPRHVTRPYLRDPQRLTTVILQRTIGTGDKYHNGRTKIFLRARTLPVLEGIRTEKQTAAIMKVQTAARGAMTRKRFRRLRAEARAAAELVEREAAGAKAKEAEAAAAVQRDACSPAPGSSSAAAPPGSPPSSFPEGGATLQPDEIPDRPASRLMRRLSSQSSAVGRVISMVIKDKPGEHEDADHLKPSKPSRRSKSKQRPLSRSRDRSPEKPAAPPPPEKDSERRQEEHSSKRRHLSPKGGKRKKFSPAVLLKSRSWKDLRSGGWKTSGEPGPLQRAVSQKKTRRSAEARLTQEPVTTPPELKIYNRFMQGKDHTTGP